MSSRRTRTLLSGGSRLFHVTERPCFLDASKVNHFYGIRKSSSRSFSTIPEQHPVRSTCSSAAWSRKQYVQASLRWNTTSLEPGDPSRPSSVYDESENWEDWFPMEEYCNPWTSFPPLDDPRLDTTTRFLIQQLQDLYHGFYFQTNRPTTEECNRVRHETRAVFFCDVEMRTLSHSRNVCTI